MADQTEEERDETNKEFVREQLKKGVPTQHLGLILTFSNLLDLNPEDVKIEFDSNQKLVQGEFRKL
jgi:hypothetical protein